MDKALVFGLTTLDIINLCERFPIEDEDVRVLQQYWQKGGNAANTSHVLSQLGIEAHLFSAFASENPMSNFARKALEDNNVVTKFSVVLETTGFPTSCCIVSKITGSRTIMHGRNGMPELTLEHFKPIDLTQYSWVHFEGRGFPHLKDIISYVWTIKMEKKLTFKISIEFEKPQRYDDLVSSGVAEFADVLFISKDFASRLGCTSGQETVRNARRIIDLKHNLIVICPWGDKGADAIDIDGSTFHADAYPPETLQDTLGAGDTLIAGVISSMVKGVSLNDSIQFGCKLAGKKCGQFGFQNLSHKAVSM